MIHGDEAESSRSAHDYVLITFCNQMFSPNHSIFVLDTASGDARMVDLSRIAESFRNEFSGTTGVCYAEGHIVFATQGPTPVLASLSIKDACVRQHISLDRTRDPHSLVFAGGFIYVVSTGTNEIYKVAFSDGVLGTEELFWRYPDVDCETDEVASERSCA